MKEMEAYSVYHRELKNRRFYSKIINGINVLRKSNVSYLIIGQLLLVLKATGFLTGKWKDFNNVQEHRKTKTNANN